MPVGQPGSSTVVTSQPQFTYQPYQGQYQFGPAVQQPVYQYQPYPGYTYQQPQQPQYDSVNPSFLGGLISQMQFQFLVILDILLLGLVS